MDGGRTVFLSSLAHEKKEHCFPELTLCLSLRGPIFTTSVLRVEVSVLGYGAG